MVLVPLLPVLLRLVLPHPVLLSLVHLHPVHPSVVHRDRLVDLEDA